MRHSGFLSFPWIILGKQFGSNCAQLGIFGNTWELIGGCSLATCWPLSNWISRSLGSLYRKILVKLCSDIVFLVHRQNLKGFERCSLSNFEIDKPVPWIHPDSKGNRRFKVMWVLRVLKIFPNMLDQRHCLHTKQKSWSCTDLQLHFPFHSFSHLS